ncbi:membrane protein [Kordiimonas sediminis]|uniref:Membrane protein n=1 Tax=Kordiimonas sediminis TaxID=1735581 RepID=A0A919AVT8_9PROT|nr:DUF599 domain-containing protein [Kordiimonas sediminis]GHF25579.1 membrane protein [Kordiimonas sediminis]
MTQLIDAITTVLTTLDLVAFGFFLVIWSVYTFLADNSPLRHKSISSAMDQQRKAWLQESLKREIRMLDTGVMQILITGVGLFASTTIFVIGGIVAGISYTGELSAAFSSLPFIVANTAEMWVIKLGVLLAIFVYAFFKFAWSVRLANYCSILIGGLPKPEDAGEQKSIRKAEAAATISSLSGHHFNRGVRAYFFALAAVAWIFDPVLFMISTVLVVAILARREFSSKSLAAIRSVSDL